MGDTAQNTQPDTQQIDFTGWSDDDVNALAKNDFQNLSDKALSRLAHPQPPSGYKDVPDSDLAWYQKAEKWVQGKAPELIQPGHELFSPGAMKQKSLAVDTAANTASLNYLPEIHGYTTTGSFSSPDYIKNRDAMRSNLDEATGGTKLVGEAIGMLPSLAGESVITPAKSALGRMVQAIGLGGAYAAAANPGETPGQLEPIQPIERLKNAKTGAITGAKIGAVLSGITELPGMFGKKALNIGLDIPDKMSGRYLDNPTAVNSSSIDGAAQELADTLGNIKSDTGPAAEQALSTLSNERTQYDGLEAKKAISTLRQFNSTETKSLADKLENDLVSRAPGLGSEPRPTTITRKSQFVPSSEGPDYSTGLKNIGETRTPNIETQIVKKQVPGAYQPTEQTELRIFNTGDTVKPVVGYSSPEISPYKIDKNTGLPIKIMSENRINGVPETNPSDLFLTEREAHDVKSALQSVAGDWKSPLPSSKMAEARSAAADYNNILKSNNNDYSSAMDELSSTMAAKNGLASKFGIVPDYTGNNESGYTYSDKTLSALKDIGKSNKVDRQRILKSINDLGYGNLSENIENALTKNSLNGGMTNGSRKAVMGATAGAAIAHFAGLPVELGAAAGGAAGGALDKYGGPIAKRIMDMSLAVNPNINDLRNATEPILRGSALGLGAIQNRIKQKGK